LFENQIFIGIIKIFKSKKNPLTNARG